MTDIQWLASDINYYAGRLEGTKDPELRLEYLQKLDDLIYTLESHVRDELYPLEETIDGQHPF